MDAYLVAMFEILVSMRFKELEMSIVNKNFVTGCDIDFIAMKSDSAQAAISTPAFPAYRRIIPIDHLFELTRVKIDEIDAAVAFALPRRADDGRSDDGRKFRH